eukprot:GILJ01001727.1.p1 GENE.GILJ01001727.1~~GILJ01001727.1.p1  ORF type:complete len:889 (+),score=160.59 GILJ01001727.1:237-2669(+)
MAESYANPFEDKYMSNVIRCTPAHLQMTVNVYNEAAIAKKAIANLPSLSSSLFATTTTISGSKDGCSSSSSSSSASSSVASTPSAFMALAQATALGVLNSANQSALSGLNSMFGAGSNLAAVLGTGFGHSETLAPASASPQVFYDPAIVGLGGVRSSDEASMKPGLLETPSLPPALAFWANRWNEQSSSSSHSHSSSPAAGSGLLSTPSTAAANLWPNLRSGIPPTAAAPSIANAVVKTRAPSPASAAPVRNPTPPPGMPQHHGATQRPAPQQPTVPSSSSSSSASLLGPYPQQEAKIAPPAPKPVVAAVKQSPVMVPIAGKPVAANPVAKTVPAPHNKKPVSSAVATAASTATYAYMEKKTNSVPEEVQPPVDSKVVKGKVMQAKPTASGPGSVGSKVPVPPPPSATPIVGSNSVVNLHPPVAVYPGPALGITGGAFSLLQDAGEDLGSPADSRSRASSDIDEPVRATEPSPSKVDNVQTVNQKNKKMTAKEREKERERLEKEAKQRKKEAKKKRKSQQSSEQSSVVNSLQSSPAMHPMPASLAPAPEHLDITPAADTSRPGGRAVAEPPVTPPKSSATDSVTPHAAEESAKKQKASRKKGVKAEFVDTNGRVPSAVQPPSPSPASLGSSGGPPIAEFAPSLNGTANPNSPLDKRGNNQLDEVSALRALSGTPSAQDVESIQRDLENQLKEMAASEARFLEVKERVGYADTNSFLENIRSSAQSTLSALGSHPLPAHFDPIRASLPPAFPSPVPFESLRSGSPSTSLPGAVSSETLSNNMVHSIMNSIAADTKAGPQKSSMPRKRTPKA